MYLFYLDESGQREYGSGTGRYFVLVAIGIMDSRWRNISNALDDLKMTYFGTVQVEVKFNWLRIVRERKKRYIDKFNISDDRLTEFTQRVHSLVENSELKVIASVIDKVQMLDHYITPQSPSSRAYVHLFERIELFLKCRQEEEHGLLVFDKINDTNFQRRGYENLLTLQHRRYLSKGTDYVQVDRIIEGIFFIPSHENNLIQLADIVAYDVYRQFHEFGKEWDEGPVRLKEFRSFYPNFEKIKHLIYTDEHGRMDGYGIKKFPEVQNTSGNVT